MKLLFVHCRRGLFQLTRCQDCGHNFACVNCSANLVTYRTDKGIFELLCHQCQTNYPYPKKCPKCGNFKIFSRFSGIEDLAERLIKDYQLPVIRLDKVQTKSQIPNAKSTISLTTRIFDPAINYSEYDKIIFIQAENLLASPDYLVQEDITKSLGEVFEEIKGTDTEVIFDTNDSNQNFFQDILKLNSENECHINLQSWYQEFLEHESKIRKAFRFPPFVNLLLLTSHEKTENLSKQKLESVKAYLDAALIDFEAVTMSDVYPAKFLKRKNLFSYHLLLKFPRQYPQFVTFRSLIHKLVSSNNLQVRLNPRHLF